MSLSILKNNEISNEELDPYYIMKEAEEKTSNWKNLSYGEQNIIISDKMEKAGYILDGDTWIKIN